MKIDARCKMQEARNKMQDARCKRQDFSYFLLLTSYFLLLPACGYTLVGKGSSLPPHIKTVSIPIFFNKSGEPNIEFEITNRIRDGFIEDGRLKLVGDGNSDLILNGDIIKYHLRPIAFDSKDNVTEYWVEIGVLIRLEERAKGSVILQQDHYTKWDYKVSQSVTEADTHRIEAIRQAGRKLAQEIVSIVVEGF
ncbi:MAG: LptE family protein [Nitrospinae bacterium]|nr:LptE family protein [Nitrospinota bacterium]